MSEKYSISILQKGFVIHMPNVDDNAVRVLTANGPHVMMF